MKVILIQDVDNLGKIGDSVNVKNGYARNFLIPNKLALFANDQNMKSIESMLKQQELKNAKERSNLESLSKVLDKVTLKFELKAGEEGKLFGSVTVQMIVDQLLDSGYNIEKKDINIPEPIKSLGNHYIDIYLHKDVSAKVKIKVKAVSI